MARSTPTAWNAAFIDAALNLGAAGAAAADAVERLTWVWTPVEGGETDG